MNYSDDKKTLLNPEQKEALDAVEIGETFMLWERKWCKISPTNATLVYETKDFLAAGGVFH